jgi:nitronate monooxygenase
MFLVSTTELIIAACTAGLIAGLPRRNARSLGEFEDILGTIRRGLDEHRIADPNALIGPVAVNLDARLAARELAVELEICRRHDVHIVISAGGDPTELVKRVRDWGGTVWHDVTTLRFAEKAIAAGADGLIAIAAGGGGQSGALSPLMLIPRLRTMFDGIIVMAGAVAHGAAIRAAEVLGADLVYLGSRFIATMESGASDDYKRMLMSAEADDLIYTDAINGIPANWLKASLLTAGLDPQRLPPREPGQRRGHLPQHAKPWKNLWSAGQGISLIRDIPTVAALVARLQVEYAAAGERPALTAASSPR